MVLFNGYERRRALALFISPPYKMAGPLGRYHDDVNVFRGHYALETYIEAMNFGAIEYVNKPFKVNELKFIVKRILERAAA